MAPYQKGIALYLNIKKVYNSFGTLELTRQHNTVVVSRDHFQNLSGAFQGLYDT